MTIDDAIVNTNTTHRCCVVTIMNIAEHNPSLAVGDGYVVKCMFTRAKAHDMVLVHGMFFYVDPVAAKRVPDATRGLVKDDAY